MNRTLCIHNGKIYGRQGLQDDTSIVIENGKISYIGDEQGIRKYMHGEFELINAQEHIVFPGFIDTHLHLSEWARQQDFLSLGHFTSLSDMVKYIGKMAKGKGWIFGSGWNQNNWRDAGFPHRRHLDGLEKGTKAIFYSKDLHSAWVNDAVIDLFPFKDVIEMISKAYLRRDEDGRLDGIIREEAMGVLLDPIMKINPSPIFIDPYKYFNTFYRHGITSVHSMEHIDDYLKYLALYQYELNRGLRIGVYIYNSDSAKVYEQDLRYSSGGNWLRFFGIKCFIDGALGSQSAWMREPYENAEHVGKKVLFNLPLQKAITRAESRSCALSIHALGDAAVEHLLDTLDYFGRPLRVPLRIEHAQCLDSGLIERMKAHNIILSVNPSHLIDDKEIAEKHWGDRSRFAFPYRSMKMADLPFAFGSDAPVESIHPWKSIYAAVQRIPANDLQPWYPEEIIRLTDAINATTYYGGIINGRNERKGVLAPGYLGDLFICSHNAFEDGLDDWEDFHSLLTVIDGKIVHNEL